MPVERVTSENYDGLRGDLLNAALSEVNWRELAENKTAERFYPNG
jgi:hypothetical protein